VRTAVQPMPPQPMLPQEDTGITPDPRSAAGKLRKALSPLASVPGVALELHSAEGVRTVLRGVPVADPSSLRSSSFAVDGIPGSKIVLSAPEGHVFDLAEVTVQAVLDRLDVEKREELLLDELGANWESLEALYEISTDVLRFGDIKSALRRLIDRLVSLQDGLQACLMLGRLGRLENIVSSHEYARHFDWSNLGPIEVSIRERRATVIAQQPAWDMGDGDVPWRTATMVAAAPITSRREKAIGLIMVWREDKRLIFDSPFSRLLEAIAYQASMLLESDRLNRAMRENERLAQEIEIASSIQQTLLMGNPPKDVPQLEIAACSAASQQIDGDFHDFLRHGPAVDVMVGDVMGKGVAAALLGAAIKSQFLRAITNLSLSGRTPSPVEIVRRAASRLTERLIAVERFVTICYARFNPLASTVEFVDCGHTGILLHRKRTGETLFLRGDDLPIGVSKHPEFAQHTAAALPGDTFLLFSDGVTETQNSGHELFGEERLIEALETWSSLGPSILLRQINKLAENFRGEQPQADDFTCVAIRVGPDAGAERTSREEREFGCNLTQLDAVRAWLGTAAVAAGIEPERQARLETACQEAFVNCILHGSAIECTIPVYLSSEIFTTHLKIEIRHQGPAFDPLAIPPPSFDGSRDGGFGTYILMRSADELEYRRERENNIISISIFRWAE
jgi:sigma-B regulation protein RsbU (phosphoserine phosphatase)